MDGTYNVKVRFIKDKRVKRISTNLFATDDDLTTDSKLKVLISLYRYQVYHCNRYHASAAIGTVRIAANGTMIIGSALLGANITIFSFSDA